MAKVYIANGPTRDELVSRVLSLVPVSFATVSGPIEILIEEMREAGTSGDRLSFTGRILSGVRVGAHVKGDYACATKSGTFEIGLNGA